MEGQEGGALKKCEWRQPDGGGMRGVQGRAADRVSFVSQCGGALCLRFPLVFDASSHTVTPPHPSSPPRARCIPLPHTQSPHTLTRSHAHSHTHAGFLRETRLEASSGGRSHDEEKTQRRPNSRRRAAETAERRAGATRRTTTAHLVEVKSQSLSTCNHV